MKPLSLFSKLLVVFSLVLAWSPIQAKSDQQAKLDDDIELFEEKPMSKSKAKEQCQKLGLEDEGLNTCVEAKTSKHNG